MTEAAIAGDGIAVEVVAGIGRHLGVALASYANIFEPDVIVIGGGAAAAGDLLLEPARRELRNRALPPMNQIQVVPAELGPDAGMIGAAAMAIEEAQRLMAGRLTVCPTPIGNLDDLSPRARRALEEADLVACEDTRRAGRLYERLELTRPRLVSNHEGNEVERARQLVAQIERGARVALISDAGTPAISDPGFRLIRACIERELEVEVLPGPSAVTTALVASGTAGRPLALRGLPAAPRRRARAGAGLARDRGRVRVPAPAARVAVGAGGARPRPRGRRLPRADQAARGGRPRDAGRARPRPFATRSRARSSS